VHLVIRSEEADYLSSHTPPLVRAETIQAGNAGWWTWAGFRKNAHGVSTLRSKIWGE
jgi:hypothetical protein